MDVSFLMGELQSGLYPILMKMLIQRLSGRDLDEVSQEDSSVDPFNQVSGEASLKETNPNGFWSGGNGVPGKYSFSELVSKASQKYNLDPDLVRAVIKAESNFNSGVVSHAGAMGLMQLMPGTARSLGVKDAFNPEENINGGTLFLSKLMNRYGGSIEKALAAYNAGPGAVDKYGGIPPYRETQVYVDRVMRLYQSYNQEG